MFLLFIYYPNGHQFRYGFISLSLFVFWVAYNTPAFQPAVANFRYSSADLQSHEQTSMEHAVYHQNLKYLNSNLKDEDAQAISTKLQDLMRSAKPYLNPDLTINRLADILQCSRHHLSQVLNDKLHQSYNDYVNALRMEEARRMLLEPQYLEHKIASIAYESGFNSLSTFNEVFKKKVGKTPTEYRKEMLKDEKRQRV